MSGTTATAKVAASAAGIGSTSRASRKLASTAKPPAMTQGSVEPHERLWIGEGGKRIGGVGQRKHQQGVRIIIAADQDRRDLGSFIGVCPEGKVDDLQQDADESNGDDQGQDEGDGVAQVSATP